MNITKLFSDKTQGLHKLTVSIINTAGLMKEKGKLKSG
jgi:hypothetical protein